MSLRLQIRGMAFDQIYCRLHLALTDQISPYIVDQTLGKTWTNLLYPLEDIRASVVFELRHNQ